MFLERFTSVRPATDFTYDLYTVIRSKSQKLLRQLAVGKINVRQLPKKGAESLNTIMFLTLHLYEKVHLKITHSV